MNCYRNLKPDPLSARAHTFDSRQPADENSKRQQQKRELLARKAKKIIKNKKVPKKVTKRPEELRKLDVQLKANFEKDLWTWSELPPIDETNEYYLKQTKKLLPERPERMRTRQTSKLPSVELPHPGMSYNPDYDDHQSLLLEAHVIELQKLQEEQKLMRRMQANAKKLSWTEIEV